MCAASVSIVPELGKYLQMGGAQNWQQFRALNPRGGGGVTESDAEDFIRTMQAMSFLGISRQQQLDIFKTVISVLLLSNVSFTPGDDSARVDASSTSTAAALLGCSQQSLHQALTHREIKVSSRETYSVSTPHSCQLTPLFCAPFKRARKGTSRHRSGSTNS